jgi:hypothetical protein
MQQIVSAYQRFGHEQMEPRPRVLKARQPEKQGEFSMRKALALSLTLILAAAVAGAQEPQKKPLSPPVQESWTINGKNITIDYSAPSKRERVVIGQLVPYGKLWRTGANKATTLKTDVDLMIGKLHVPAGTYTLLTIPEQNEWTLVVSKQSGLWGTNGYDQAQDLGRVKMTVEPVKETVEQFAIDLVPGKNNKGTLTMTWENVRASVPVMVH